MWESNDISLKEFFGSCGISLLFKYTFILFDFWRDSKSNFYLFCEFSMCCLKNKESSCNKFGFVYPFLS